MIELLTSSLIIGQALIGPNLLQTEYLTPNQQVITIQETIQEDSYIEPCHL